ncbi:DNA sulfur modification protein DndD [Kushneria marisflavi]|uniref:DNA sulfur modification protein DndD n=1 Tax=Kushneria marisflavi TaxID=157779 RepID=A0A240UQ25_9GAMM|nr:DNA sulfur modification protein DndD [Kushneria marisflavi]ART63120.1 DNA sulfur modification protein DndD [Kushneria marisflavi]RKD84627.1 DNA sulfur modification protein DndD [Kushneria marisflavi]
MLIKELTLTDFRVYEGVNHFNLCPEKHDGKLRPIILFGGLNGAGKTSILLGIRLALYGKLCLGSAVSQRRYDEFLLEALHHSRATGRSANTAAVELTFTYAKLGTENQYHVKREWERRSNGVKESLTIHENEAPIKGLNQEQAQNFLNELIPAGVSDLFFFDGEKIAQLADDTGGAALEQSIKKLLGLDVVERLAGDLTVLNRNLTKRSSAQEIQSKIDSEQSSLERCRAQIESVRQKINTLYVQRAETQEHANRLQKDIDDRGGHFSAPRKQLESRLVELQGERDRIVSRINILMSDAAPLALAEAFCARTESQIENDLNLQTLHRERRLYDEYRTQLAGSLDSRLSADALAVVLEELDNLGQATSGLENQHPVHDVTSSQASQLFSVFREARKQKDDVVALFEALEKVETDLDEIGASLARAPDDLLIASDFENLQQLQQTLGRLNAEIDTLRNQGRETANEAVESARRLDRLYEEAAKSGDQKRVFDYINNASGLLTDYVGQTATAKIRDLETQFTDCFAKLSRKNDLDLQIRIDTSTFHVSLLTDNGKTIAKDELSAGEKQIFAISMLEALAKTSGRQLPMIVDTPLGRLDSEHRARLVEGYFPVASHQMIILSTDTEVDESFYSVLSPDISRAYKLEYDSAAGATRAYEGYFWQEQEAH